MIRCAHCRRNISDGELSLEAAPAGVGSGPTTTRPVPAAAPPRPPTASEIPRTEPATTFAPSTVSAPARQAWAPPATFPLSNIETRRAMPESRRTFGPDLWMLWAGMAAAAAGILAYLAVKEPWAHLTVTQPATEVADAVVVQVTVRGHAAFVGTAGTVLAIVLAVFGVLWFFYGFQRGWSMPGILNPALAILVTVAGLGMTLFASMVWFVWEDAMVLRASAAGLTPREMRTLLETQPIPIVEIERLPGMVSFGGMMALGLVAACLGWWAYRRRG